MLLRTPTTSVTRFQLDLDEAGNLTRLESSTRDPRAAADARPLRRETIERRGDSLVVTVGTATGESTTGAVAAPPATLPFLDMIHWPYEVAIVRAMGAPGASRDLPLLIGRSVATFGLRTIARDSVAITHPTRGTMTARIDRQGRLLGLDARATTRAVTVERRPYGPIDAVARRFAAADAEGRPFGALSGRAEESTSVHGATITLDYGTPAKRGREIWGALVPWDELWRTGANLATHVTTDRALQFGDLVVPAGRYTLYSIPSPSGGTLVISRQTGQNGQQYDPAQDLGRVPLQIRKLATPVETFTIEVTETAAGGELSLRWDRAAFVAPFRVRQ